MRVLLWGFYSQFNLGDDIMALMLADIIRSLGQCPIIFSQNPVFSELGYETASALEDASCDAVVLGGGAFFKRAHSSNATIEGAAAQLANFLRRNDVPVAGVSLGSDGALNTSELSTARRAIIDSPRLKSVAVRLQQDLRLDLPNATFIPDIVLAVARHFRDTAGARASETERITLINLTLRAAPLVPVVLWRTLGNARATFYSNSNRQTTGGEISIPFITPLASRHTLDALRQISSSDAIYSSKLHPGVMALSYGSTFFAVHPRPKTQAFIREYAQLSLISANTRGRVIEVSSMIDQTWQASLLEQYRDHLEAFFAAP